MKRILAALALCVFFCSAAIAGNPLSPKSYSGGSPISPSVGNAVNLSNPNNTGILGFANGGTAASDTSTASENLVGVVNAAACGYTSGAPSWCSGSDVGAWINAAISHIGSGQGKIILAPKFTYSYSTTPIVPNNIQLDCQYSLLNYTPSSGAALISAEPSWSSSIDLTLGKIENCSLHHTGGYTSGNTNIGIYSGGDPTNTLTPSNYFGPMTTFKNVDISGFKYAYTHGNNTWNIEFENSKLHSNYDGFYSPSTASNAGELMLVKGGTIYDNSNCGIESVSQNDNWDFQGTRFDYNGNGVACGSKIFATFEGYHFEQAANPLFNFNQESSIKLTNGTVHLASGWSDAHGIFYMLGNGSLFNNISIDSMFINGVSGVTMPPYLVYTNSAPSLSVTTSNLQVDLTGFSWASTPVTDALVSGAAAVNSGALNIAGGVAITRRGIAVGVDSGFSGSLSPTNGISVEGSVGIGTNNPSRPLQVYNPNTNDSDLTIEALNAATGKGTAIQSSASSNYVSFVASGTGQKWQFGQWGNTNYKIYDATNNKTPFTIASGAPDYSMFVSSSGSLLLGTYTQHATGIADELGQLLVRGGTAPAISSCGTSPTIAGADSSFVVTVGTGGVTACSITFGTAFTTYGPNVCTITPMNATAANQGTTGAYVTSISTTGLTISGAALDGAKYGVHCY